MGVNFGTMFGAVIVLCGFLTGNALQHLAVGKTAYQTDVGWDGEPGQAVDGNNNTDSTVEGGNCAHTTSTTNAWWEVDLGNIFNIDHVNVFGRTDCCVERFRHVQVYIGYGNSQDDYVLRGFYDGILPVPYTFQLTSPVYGRWVRITRPSTVNSYDDQLSLCEVEVMGDKMTEVKFEFGDGKSGTGNLLQTSQARTKTECCVQCKMTDKCSAVNYNSATKACEKLETVSASEDSSQDNYFYRLP